MKHRVPPKVQNLIIASDLGLRVPLFFVLDSPKSSKFMKNFLHIKEEFRKKNIQKVIIRSAASIEDDEKSSLAGYFESSESIDLEDLTSDDISHYWNLNKKKLISKKKDAKLFLFVQEFIEFEYSGVFFTESPYNKNEAILNFSSSDFGVTSGGAVEISGVYNADTDKWKFTVGGEEIKKSIINKIASLKTFFSSTFTDGADIELGIKDGRVYIVQVRPITRSTDEQILLIERERLKLIYGSELNKQLWDKNNFTDALGDLTPLSLSMYNTFLNSANMNSLLLKGGFLQKDAYNINQNQRFLECIGKKTYYNTYLAKTVFSQPSGLLNSFSYIFKLVTKENILFEESQSIRGETVALEEAFSWLYISGMYFQFFLFQDKQKYKKDFSERLKNTEFSLGAADPILHKADDINKFKDKYFYLAEDAYELASKRVKELTLKEIGALYLNEKQPKNNQKSNGPFLGSKTTRWLTEKIYWKNVFLKALFIERLDLLQNHDETIFMADNWLGIKNGDKPNFSDELSKDRISDNYHQITGSNYPFAMDSADISEIVIVPGKIDINEINFIKADDDPALFFGKTIAVYQYPNSWISKIPKFKAIILYKGNELSHMAITCREYSVPLRINPSLFKDGGLTSEGQSRNS